MKTIFALLFAFVSYNCLAQTKLIAHKSHSGKTSTFRTAIEGNLFGINKSNFGIIAKALIKLDTVIYLGGNKVMVVKRVNYYSGKLDTSKLKITKNWNLIRTTSENDPIFSNFHSVSDIKKELLRSKEIYIDINQTVFIGFDNKQPKKR